VPGNLAPGLSSAPVKNIRFGCTLPAMHVHFMWCEMKSQVRMVTKRWSNLTLKQSYEEQETRSCGELEYENGFLNSEGLYPTLALNKVRNDRDVEHLTLVGFVSPIEHDEPYDETTAKGQHGKERDYNDQHDADCK
jgi:hypothetical protein